MTVEVARDQALASAGSVTRLTFGQPMNRFWWRSDVLF